MSDATAKHYATCPLCEATCGLEIQMRDGAITRIEGDANDTFSRGFICPKGAALQQLHADPDRLRAPLVREPGGEFSRGVVAGGVRVSCDVRRNGNPERIYEPSY